MPKLVIDLDVRLDIPADREPNPAESNAELSKLVQKLASLNLRITRTNTFYDDSDTDAD